MKDGKPHVTKDAVVIGVDEAGRGPLAGPIVAAAVHIPPTTQIAGLRDSKKIPEKERECLARLIREKCLWEIEEISAQEINLIGIEKANKTVMERCAERMLTRLGNNAIIKVDGRKKGFQIPAEFHIQGEDKFPEIAAASILAKCHRDALMQELETKYPGYGLGAHKGYGTKQHREAIRQKGETPEHRKAFLRKLKELQEAEAALEKAREEINPQDGDNEITLGNWQVLFEAWGLECVRNQIEEETAENWDRLPPSEHKAIYHKEWERRNQKLGWKPTLVIFEENGNEDPDFHQWVVRKKH